MRESHGKYTGRILATRVCLNSPNRKDTSMIHIGWSFAMAAAETSALSILFAYLYDGLFDGYITEDGENLFGIGFCGAIVGLACLGAFVGFTGVSSQLATTAEAVKLGLLVPLAGSTALAGTIGACAGMCLGLRRFGSAMRDLPNTIKQARGLFARSTQKPESAVALPQQRSVEEQVNQKFTAIQERCRALRDHLREGSTFGLLNEISLELDKVRKACKEDGNKQAAVPTLLTDYLEPTEEALCLYERLLKRNVASARSAVEEMERDTLPLMRDTISALYDQIHVVDVARLSTIASKFQVARKLDVKLAAEAEAEAKL
jgi:hypothetical protein